MFDKNLFDRSSYDRSVASDGLSGDLLSAGQMILLLTVAQPVPLPTFISQSSLDAGVQILIPAGSTMEASGVLNDMDVVLRQPLTIGFSGTGTSILYPTVITPIDSIAIDGESTLESIHDFVYQHVTAKLLNSGDIGINAVIQQEIGVDISGSSTSGVTSILFKLPLTFDLHSDGSLVMRRIGSLNEDLFQLVNINLQPGEEVTIDTDLFDVFFGYRSDVASVTTDSVFFDLNPGENEILISTDTQSLLQVTAIWQNRWL